MPIYATATFLSAFLLFFVQPLLAKAVLPWFGGASSVWTTSLVFYQTLLLGGYLYAHVSRRFGATVQTAMHVALLFGSLAALPILPAASWRPTGTEEPTLHLLATLAASVGPPYLLLASTAPLLHDWFARTYPARSPYALYAVSNGGSLLALLAYPFVAEPLLGVGGQATLWAGGYIGLVALIAGLAWHARSRMGVARRVVAEGGDEAPPAPGRVTLWVLLAAGGSGLLLATTNQITLDVASVPFLWVMPLAVYLVTYVLAFAGWYSRTAVGTGLAIGLGVQALLWAGDASVRLGAQVAGASAVLFVGCLFCHGELARSAPAPSHLTTFYLAMAGGGAAGGAAVSLAAPALLPDFWELPIFLLLSWVLLGVVLWTDPGSALRGGGRPMAWRGLLLVGIVAAFAFVLPTVIRDAGTIAAERNFYGVLRVQQGESPEAGQVRGLRHGRILHGSQLQDPARADAPTAYYAEESGAHRVFRDHPRRRAGESLRVAVIGQGVGAVAAWGRPGDTIRFFELNPAVDRFARAYFTYLDRSRAHIDVVLGDGRLSLERDIAGPTPSRGYDVIMVDAFSGDAIPTHLLTREAAELYGRALAADGVLAFHVTNRHLDLSPVVRGLAEELGRRVVRVERDSDPSRDIGVSQWLLVATDPGPYLGAAGASLEPAQPSRLWTDRFSNLLHVLR